MKSKLLLLSIILLGFCCLDSYAQQCVSEPTLNAPDIDPAPLAPEGSGGNDNGTYSFNYLESLLDYPFVAGQEVVIEITHTDITPIGGAAAVSGTGADVFTWVYDAGANTLTGTQNQDLLVQGYDINVAFEVTAQAPNCPGNVTGFVATIIPPACNTFNNTTNDTSSSLTCVDQTLPVELTAFDATLVNNKDGYLTWSTATEFNNDRFDIERSLDGVNFDFVDAVDGAGTTDQARTYNYTDLNLPALNATEIYYRLKQIDFDGAFAYSNIELINLSGQGHGLQVISVDFGGQYRLKENSGEGINRVELYSSNGTHIYSEDYDGSDLVDLNVNTLSQGVYILLINNKYHRKLIVTK